MFVVFSLFLLTSLSGCQTRTCPSLESGDPIPIDCLSQPQYRNATVTIHSKYLIRSNRTLATEPSIYFGRESPTLFLDITNAQNGSILVDGQTYFFTGTFFDGILKVIEIRPG